MTSRHREILAAYTAVVDGREAHEVGADELIDGITKAIPDADPEEIADALAVAIDRKQREADHLRQFVRLAQATGCPEDEPVIPWLLERGLVERDANGDYVAVKAGPRPH